MTEFLSKKVHYISFFESFFHYIMGGLEDLGTYADLLMEVSVAFLSLDATLPFRRAHQTTAKQNQS